MTKQWKFAVVAALVLGALAALSALLAPGEVAVPRAYQCNVYTEQGCDKYVVTSDGELELSGELEVQSAGEVEVLSGGILDVQEGATFNADTIAETTAGNGVVIDGLRIRDSGIGADIVLTGTLGVSGGDITFENGGTLGEAVDTVLDFSEFLAATEQSVVVVGVRTPITPTGTYQPITSTAAVSTSLTNAIVDGTVNGQLLILVNENAADAIIVVDGANTKMGGDKTLTGGEGDSIFLWWDGSDWLCIGYNDN